MRRYKKIRKSTARQKSTQEESAHSSRDALTSLQDAWNDQNLYMSSDERFLFLEVTERVVKVHDKLKAIFEMEERMSKN